MWPKLIRAIGFPPRRWLYVATTPHAFTLWLREIGVHGSIDHVATGEVNGEDVLIARYGANCASNENSCRRRSYELEVI